MPTITSTVTVRAPVESVYELAKQIERLPEFDETLQSVRIIEREGARTVSEWVGLIPEFRRTIQWTEEDLWDDEARVCRFAQTAGDFEEYRGTWSFVGEADGTTRVDLVLEYEFNVPLIGALIKNLLRQKTQQAADATLAAIKQLAEAEA